MITQSELNNMKQKCLDEVAEYKANKKDILLKQRFIVENTKYSKTYYKVHIFDSSRIVWKVEYPKVKGCAPKVTIYA